MRPYWKGYLKLALVSCPIALHAACSTAERITFRQINKATGNRLRQQLIDEETREPVDPSTRAAATRSPRGSI
jgi:DNA end-binding protein Ku